jgi:pyruvate,orthophosphate dikinase
MEVAAGILTSRGGMTSHAAVVTRGMGKCCVAGAGDIDVTKGARDAREGPDFKEGDWISLDGTTGRVIKGKLNTLDPSPDDPELQKFMNWAEPHRKMKVRANADIPRDAIQARAFGAEGIGLCRTEHMFFGEEKIPHMRAMILADNEKDRRAALKKLLPMQRKDFAGVFKAMDGLPVTIRTLDPPLHEFLPRREDLMVEIARSVCRREREESAGLKIRDYGAKGVSDLKKAYADAAGRVEQLHEFNPMLGHRGCRLGITYPEITEMQARAIFEAAVAVAKKGIKVPSRGDDPAHRHGEGNGEPGGDCEPRGEEVFQRKGKKVDYLVGTMIELPRAALVADEIAKEAEFFSFGTNDLTQTTFGFSRDDVNKVLPTYLAEGILKQDPFAALDREGVGQLVRWRPNAGARRVPDAESRNLRRAWRRAIVGGVLLSDGIELRFLLTVPRADRATRRRRRRRLASAAGWGAIFDSKLRRLLTSKLRPASSLRIVPVV